MKNTYSRKVPATTSKDQGFKKLTNKQLAVYYWLISKAYWNSDSCEQHYFVYRNTINYAQMGRELGIKSYNTIKSAFNKLEEYGMIELTDTAVLIPHAEVYTYLNIDLIRFLFQYSIILGAELLLFYSILKRMFELDQKQGKKTSFYIKMFVLLLGHNEKDDNTYLRYRTYLDILAQEGLIKISAKENRIKGAPCLEYTLWDIKKDLPLSCYININGEKEVNIPEEKMEKLREEFKCIIK